ncbi:MAG: FAD-binding monooxygenase [Myxococcales bacterium]|nr:hypothetical protein [Myxococcales bacterium]MCB9717156.1 FAD-binding monooxygenase [Myxococcales bacterium]
MTSAPTIDHAVVLGGSMTGMLTAAALARHARRVTVLERDAFPDEPGHRKGTPQDQQVHVLLDRGRIAVDHLLPGLSDELVEHGSHRIDLGDAMWWYHYDRWKVRCQTPYQLYMQSRPFLEHHVRRRARALPNVELRARTEMDEPVVEDGRVRAVRVRPRGEASVQILPCELFVDASGRGSRAPRWLEALGYPTPREEQTQLGLAYSTCFYRRPSVVPDDWKAMVVYGARPSQLRHGLLFTVEDDRWVIGLAGYGGDAPPDDPEGFLEFMRSLDRPELYELVSKAEPLAPPRAHKFPYQRWFHYEELDRLPAGFAVVGDAMCSFDPVFGQGMSAGAIEAEALERHLARGQGFDARAFAKACARIAKNPWALTLSEALRYPSSEGQSPPGLPLLHRFLDRVFACSSTDPVVYRAFLDVMQLHAGPETLFRPRVLWHLLRATLAPAGARAPLSRPG